MLSNDQWILVLAMTAVLFLTRIAGLLIADRLPDSRRLRQTLDVLPGITMVSIVLPAVASSGPIGIVASLLVWGIVTKTGSLGIAIVAGVGLVALAG
jgi:uncharacterized membrane protein